VFSAFIRGLILRVKIITDERCTGYSRQGHPERPERVAKTIARLQSQTELPITWVAPGESVADEIILRAHTPAVLARLAVPEDFDEDTPFHENIGAFARTSVAASLDALRAARNGETVFSLMRPPGHHAMREKSMGFCYLNNIAIAAQYLADAGMRPAILDVDYHHGNGTQSIFYGRSDVFFCSLHADPHFAYPHFLGFADEQGESDGEGFNLNLPLPANTDWALYEQALARGLAAVEAFGPDVLLVSLGLDTYIDDPIASFRLKPADYLRLGEKIAALKRPTLFVFEGGYNIEALGEITANVLEGFADK
jgi:acetoin utilization deacetylase AcuC-like enzyme